VSWKLLASGGPLTLEESIRIQAKYPQATRDSIASFIDPWLRHATPEEAWRWWALIDECLAGRDREHGELTSPDDAAPTVPADIRVGYRKAQRADLRPSQAAVAREMGIGARRLQERWSALHIGRWEQIHELMAAREEPGT
jgi:hypothetical protein